MIDNAYFNTDKVNGNIRIQNQTDHIQSDFQIEEISVGLNHLRRPSIRFRSNTSNTLPLTQIYINISINRIEALVNDLNRILEHAKKQQP